MLNENDSLMSFKFDRVCNVWSLGSSKLEIRTNIDETIGTLRFRTRMKKVSIVKGTIQSGAKKKLSGNVCVQLMFNCRYIWYFLFSVKHLFITLS